MTPPRAPAGLSKQAQRLWRDTLATYVVEADRLVTLELACRALTRLEAAEAVLDSDGLTTTGSKGQVVPHPMLAAVDRERSAYVRLVRLLGLEA
jgi:phage terminase small subunit